MRLRSLNLPADLAGLSELLPATFVYPDHPEWSLQTDELAELASALGTLKMLWPLFRAAQMVVPSFRDWMRGFVADEDGTLAGCVLYHRKGSTDAWDISTVGMLPGFRRRGLARQLVQKALADIAARGGKRVTLGVIEENVPARSLYKSLGFEDFGGFVKYEAEAADFAGATPSAGGVELSRLARFDWRPRFEFHSRIAPSEAEPFDPVTKEKYRDPLPVRPLVALIFAVRRMKDEDFIVRIARSPEPVAIGGYSLPTRGKGIARAHLSLDPTRSELAPALLQHLLRLSAGQRQDLRIEISISHNMPHIIGAAEALGMNRRVDSRRMGLVL